MSERGVFAVDRGIWDHEEFAEEPFTEREAWMWLISEAAWKPRSRRIGRLTVSLDRGQLSASLRFLAERWGWQKDRVDRFLTRLKTATMIETANETGINVVTVCNYDEYQRVSLPSATANETPNATATRQQRDKREDIESIEEKKDSCAVAKATRPKTSEAFDQFWKAYPRRLGANPKVPASKVFEAALKQGADASAIVAGARRCAVADADKIGTPYIPQAVKWLRDRRWEDYSAESQPAEGLMSEAERTRLFAELRKPLGNPNGLGPETQGRNLSRPGAGPREGEGEGKAQGKPPPVH